jgi:hypothetical protein
VNDVTQWRECHQSQERTSMAKSNRESKKPKKEKIKIIAAAPSQKGMASLPQQLGSGKKR